MNPPPASSPAAPRIGIVGAGRTRNGLGPYLARAFAAAGARIAGVAGRDLPGAQRAAAALEEQHGGPIAAFAEPMALARAVDALVVASPAEVHVDGLCAAAAAGVACLCEKPLVPVGRTADGLALIAGFRERGLLLAENCQWPEVLPALYELHPGLVGAPVRHVAMGLGPAHPGPAMLADSVSHVLSVVQALADVDPEGHVERARQRDAGGSARSDVVTFRIAAATGPVDVELHLECTPQQPRPAWLAVDGHRIDRRVGAGYRQSFVSPDGHEALVQDPLQALVYGFVAQLATRDRQRTRRLADSLTLRLRLQASLFAALGR